MTLLEAGNRLADASGTVFREVSNGAHPTSIERAIRRAREALAAWREAVARQEDDGK